jgi:molybdenum cofactor biosynthesis enzyme
MTRKTKQPRLLPRLEPIAETDALTLADLTTRYRCRCGNTAETGIKLEAVTCVRCGSAMKPERSRNPPP